MKTSALTLAAALAALRRAQPRRRLGALPRLHADRRDDPLRAADDGDLHARAALRRAARAHRVQGDAEGGRRPRRPRRRAPAAPGSSRCAVLLAAGLVVRVLDEAGRPLAAGPARGSAFCGRARCSACSSCAASLRTLALVGAPPPAPHRVPHAARHAGRRDRTATASALTGLDARPLPVRPRPRALRRRSPRATVTATFQVPALADRAHGQPRRRRAVVPRGGRRRGRSARASSAATTRPTGASSSTATSSAR